MLLPSLKKDHHVVILFAFFALLYGVLLIYFKNPISDELLVFLVIPILISAFYGQTRIYIPLTIIIGIVSSVVLYFVAYHPLSSTVTAIVILAAVSMSSELIFLTLKKNKEILKSLQAERNLLEKINETIPIGVVVVKQDGQISFANQKAEDILGLTIDDLSLRSYNSSQWQITDIDGNPFPDENLPFQKVIRSKTPVYDIRHSIKSPNGKVIHLSINGAPLLNENNQLDSVVFSVEDITEQIQKEKELVQSEKSIRNILESSPMGIHLYRLDENDNLIFTGANPAADHILGIEHQPLIGKTIEHLFPFHQHTAISKHYKQICRYGNVWHSDYLSSKDDQLEGVFEVNAFQTVPNHMAVFFMDVTEREKLNKALKESEKRFKHLIEHSPVAIGVSDMEGNITYINQEFVHTMGYTLDELATLDDWWDKAYPESSYREKARQSWEMDIQEAKVHHVDFKGKIFTIHCKDGVDRTFNISGTRIDDHFIVIFNDITDQIKIENELREREMTLQSIFRAAPIGIGYVRDRILGWTNEFFQELVGYTKDELYNQSTRILYPTEEEFLRVGQIIYKKPQTSHTSFAELKFKHRNGHLITVVISITPLDFEDISAGHIFTVQDLTNLKQAEEVRNRLFKLSVDMFCIATPNGYFQELNPAWEKTLGWSKDEFLSKPWIDFVHPDDVEETIRTGHQLINEGKTTINFENRYRCKDGSWRWLSWNSTHDKNEELIFAVARDVTEQKKLEAQLIHSQKMEAVGQLAGGIAHDFNNLLTAILGYSDLIMIRLSQNDPLLNEMGEIKKSAERAMGLTRQLLAFSRKQIMQPIPLDLNELIVNIDKMLRRIIGEDIEFIIIPGKNLSLVKADPGQVEQVIINLAVNARDAMPQGGKLIIETQNVIVDSNHSRRDYGIPAGSYVLVSITDTGLGIKPAILDKIFEPFFTTKEKGKGTGLGLSTVHGIIQQSGGYIAVESELNQGTTFKIYLPQAETSVPQKPQSQETVLDDLPQGNETILLVEDEELVRNLVETVLSAQGYSVISASYGEEALQSLSGLQNSIDLLITDVVLPQMSGKDLALEILKTRPATKVLYISGYTDDAIVHHGVLEEGIYFLQKPFLPNILLEKVYEILSTEGT